VATYYVRPDGNDSNPGTGPSASMAWATVSKAAARAAAGDTVYIAGGTYREASGVTVANSGTAEAPIVFAGDPMQVQFPDLLPKPVRITGCDASEYGARAGDLLTCGRDYVTWQDVVLDGHLSGIREGVNFVAVGNGRNLIRCVVLSCSRGVRRASYIADCLVLAGRDAIYECTLAERCVTIGAETGFDMCPEVRNCIAIGGRSYGVHGTVGSGGGQVARNCLALGNGYGFAGVYAYGCLAVGCYWGYYLGVAERCLAHTCYIGYQAMEANDCLLVNTRTATSGTVTQRSGANPPAAGRWVGWLSWMRMVRELATLLEPDLFFEPAAGVEGPAQDILLRPRPLGALGATTTPGPWEYSTVERAGSDGVRIERAGVADWAVGATAGSELTVTCRCTFQVGEGQAKPQLIVFGPDVEEVVATAQGDGSEEELSVNVSVAADTVLTVRAYARDGSEGSWATFADWEISNA